MSTNIITPRLCWTVREPFDPLYIHPSGEQNSVCFDVTMKYELLALVSEGFGYQEESEVEALLKRVSTSCAYRSEFDKPCDCSQGIAAAGQFRSSLLSHANRSSTF